MSDITLVLQAIGRGDHRASAELLPLVYDELRRLAAARMAREAAGQVPTLDSGSYRVTLPLTGSAQFVRLRK